MNIFNISVIGVGKLGGALALALSNKGYEVRQLIVRSDENATRIAEMIKPRPLILSHHEFEKIDSDVVFIAVQDSEISLVAEILAKKLEHIPFVFHTSGALTSKVLHKLNGEGCEVASFHPLVSISDSISGANNFKDAYFCIEGDIEAVIVGKQIVSDLEGKPFSVETKNKSLYHASAVTACGHLVALISAAIEMLTECGLEADKAQKILLPLIKSTVSNLESKTPAEALTGTFARADVETLRQHLEILEGNVSDETRKIYLQLGLYSIPLAKEQGADEAKLEEMRKILESAGQ